VWVCVCVCVCVQVCVIRVVCVCCVDPWWHTNRMSHVTTVMILGVSDMTRAYAWVMSHKYMCHVIYMNESCHTDRMSHVTRINVRRWWHDSCIWMSHVAQIHESRHIHGWVVPHRWNESYDICQCQALATWLVHVNTSCHTNTWEKSHTWMGRVTQIEWVMLHMPMRGVSDMTRACGKKRHLKSYLTTQSHLVHKKKIHYTQQAKFDKHTLQLT